MRSPLAGSECLSRRPEPPGVQVADSDAGTLVQQRAGDSQAEGRWRRR